MQLKIRSWATNQGWTCSLRVRVSHLSDADDTGGRGVEYIPFSYFFTAVAVLSQGHVGFSPQEIVEMLLLHFLQLLVLLQKVLVMLPVSLVVVLLPELFFVDVYSRPSSNFCQFCLS